MPRFGKRSKENLETCHEDLQDLFNEVIKTYDCKVTCGHRGEKDQNKAFKDGRSKVKFPKGRHNSSPSKAVDVYPYPVNMQNLDRMIHFAGFVLGKAKSMEINIKWGRDWDSDWYLKDKNKTKFKDYPHFELIKEF
tara:strand:- start:940 stop:1347 length:408 start_codon:yes stop_codon:yes gene_type:complete